jgi:hypothetical protein
VGIVVIFIRAIYLTRYTSFDLFKLSKKSGNEKRSWLDMCRQTPVVVSQFASLLNKDEKTVAYGIGAFFFVLEHYLDTHLVRAWKNEFPGYSWIEEQYFLHSREYRTEFSRLRTDLIGGPYKALNHLLYQLIREGFVDESLQLLVTLIIRFLQRAFSPHITQLITEKIPGFDNLIKLSPQVDEIIEQIRMKNINKEHDYENKE